MAAFHLIIYGRFWVITEARRSRASSITLERKISWNAARAADVPKKW
jgi:hypothetical protein